MKDNFSAQSKAYAAFRPKFPAELFQFINSHVKEFDLAWDAGTGNGQAAVQLAPHFKKVYATDISQNQIDNAEKASNITYVVEGAEASSLATSSVDLVTVSQAIHWFDFDKFYDEARRVAKPGAILAAFAYSMFQAEDVEVNELIKNFYAASSPYWDTERKYIDEGYQTIPFPFDEIETPSFQIKYRWTIEQVLGYIETWSANQHHIKKFGTSLVSKGFTDELRRLSSDQPIDLCFPVHMRMGRL